MTNPIHLVGIHLVILPMLETIIQETEIHPMIETPLTETTTIHLLVEIIHQMEVHVEIIHQIQILLAIHPLHPEQQLKIHQNQFQNPFLRNPINQIQELIILPTYMMY